jgi:hypothetical protein
MIVMIGGVNCEVEIVKVGWRNRDGEVFARTREKWIIKEYAAYRRL